jgi:hypothetical protein
MEIWTALFTGLFGLIGAGVGSYFGAFYQRRTWLYQRKHDEFARFLDKLNEMPAIGNIKDKPSEAKELALLNWTVQFTGCSLLTLMFVEKHRRDRLNSMIVKLTKMVRTCTTVGGGVLLNEEVVAAKGEIWRELTEELDEMGGVPRWLKELRDFVQQRPD